MHVIVTDCHYRSSLSIIRELAAAGHEVTSVCEEGPPPLGHHCKQTTTATLFPPRLSESDYTECLLNLCSARRKSVLLPVGARTLHVISRARDQFAPLARFLVADEPVLEQAGDKHGVARLACSLDIPIPEPILLDPVKTLEEHAASLSYPVVLKYRNGEKLGLSAERRYTIAHNAGDFLTRYRTMSDVQTPVLVQEYIQGPGLGVSVLMDQAHRPVRVFCHERLREYPVSGGPSTACRSDWFPTLAERAVTLLQALHFTGFAMVEFKGPPDNARLLEINPRIWGSYPLATRSGAGMAEAYVRAAYGEEPHDTALACRYTTGVRMQFLLNDLMAGLGYLRQGHIRASLAVVRDAFSRKVDGGVYAPGDRPGSWFYLKSALFHRR